MVRMAGVTGQTPVSRMTVARGRLEGAPADIPPDLVAAARTAAVFAVKDAARLIPTAPPVSLTDAFCDLDRQGDDWVATVTVVGLARATLDAMALAGVGTALLALWDAAKGHDASLSEQMRVAELRIVQNVDS